MKQLFYLGTTELAFDMDLPIAGQEFNRKFMRPILPVTARSNVRVEPKATLTVPFSAEERGCASWEMEGYSFCAYAQQGRWLSVSCLQPDGDVTLFVEESRLELFKASFRPWYQIQLERLMLRNQALILHAASIEHRGEAILFTARSGTGKTTQTDLWHQYVPDVTDLNGDKVLLQKTGNGWMACGYPIYGSSTRCEQKALPIRAIVVVHRSREDRVEEISELEQIMQLYRGITAPREENDVVHVLEFVEEIAMQVRILRLDCTMRPSAAYILYRYLYGNEMKGICTNGIV